MISISNVVTITISIMLSCLTLIYYTRNLLICKHSKTQTNLIIIYGYIALCIICYMQNTILNIVGFIVVNFIVLYIGFKDSIGSIFMRVIVLLVFMMFGELIMALILDFPINHEIVNADNISALDDAIFSISAKLIYFLETLILRHVSLSRNRIYKSKEMFLSLILPMATIAYLVLVNRVMVELSGQVKILFSLVGIMLIASNFIVYIVCDRMVDKSIKIQELQNVENKKEIDYKSYELIKDKYEELRIMIHDFEKLCNNIEGLLNDDQIEVLSVIHDIRSKCKEFMLVEYTNNKALNILLSQKMQECNKNKIDFQINIKNIDLTFLKEVDVVSIFANLIDNAIESCISSREKKIFLSIDTMSVAYVVIRMDNSSDSEPRVSNGRLQTHKLHKNVHGVGMSSIERALKNYSGKLKWEYNSDTHVFRTIILINYKKIKN